MRVMLLAATIAAVTLSSFVRPAFAQTPERLVNIIGALCLQAPYDPVQELERLSQRGIVGSFSQSAGRSDYVPGIPMSDEERRMAVNASAWIELDQGRLGFHVSRDRRDRTFVCEIDVINVPASAAPTWQVFESILGQPPIETRRYQEPVRLWQFVRGGRVTMLGVASRLKPRGFLPPSIPLNGFTIYVDSRPQTE